KGKSVEVARAAYVLTNYGGEIAVRKNGGSLEDRYVQGTVFPLRVTTVDFLDYFVLILFEGGGGFPDESLHPGHIHALIAANFARDGTRAESWETGEQHNEYDESFFHTPDLSLAGKNLSFEHERFLRSRRPEFQPSRAGGQMYSSLNLGLTRK